MISGFIVGILIVGLVLAIIGLINSSTAGNFYTDWNEKKDKECLTAFGKINIVIAVVVLCLSTFIGARIHIRIFEGDIRQFESAKATYSEAIKSEGVTGLERIEIVNKITEENKTLARLKYDATK